jgi:hypothetical protein
MAMRPPGLDARDGDLRRPSIIAPFARRDLPVTAQADRLALLYMRAGGEARREMPGSVFKPRLYAEITQFRPGCCDQPYRPPGSDNRHIRTPAGHMPEQCGADKTKILFGDHGHAPARALAGDLRETLVQTPESQQQRFAAVEFHRHMMPCKHVVALQDQATVKPDIGDGCQALASKGEIAALIEPQPIPDVAIMKTFGAGRQGEAPAPEDSLGRRQMPRRFPAGALPRFCRIGKLARGGDRHVPSRSEHDVVFGPVGRQEHGFDPAQAGHLRRLWSAALSCCRARSSTDRNDRPKARENRPTPPDDGGPGLVQA